MACTLARPFRRRLSLAAALLAAITAAARPAAAAPPREDAPAAAAAWSLHDGDRVVFLGDTFVEREGDRGFIETALVAAHPDAALSFRNLGWSGDTVWAESRGVFDQPAKGYDRMLTLVRELRPTILFVAYGRNESHRGQAGLEDFRTQLAKLCDDLRAAAAAGPAAAAPQPADVRLVLVTPHRFETADAAARNASLAPYAEAIRDVAAAKRAGLVDLFTRLPTPSGEPLTENGVHLSDAGYAAAARVFASAADRVSASAADRVSASAAGGGPSAEDAARTEHLRERVVAKNRLFFHRWRPANETYIFLFRRHEQGNNAVEIPQFDPLVEAAEQEVQSLAKAFAAGPENAPVKGDR